MNFSFLLKAYEWDCWFQQEGRTGNLTVHMLTELFGCRIISGKLGFPDQSPQTLYVWDFCGRTCTKTSRVFSKN
jgi:hypothetical protein